MMSFSRGALLFFLFGAALLKAQTAPGVSASIPSRVVPTSGAPVAIDLRNHFEFQGVTARTPIVQFDTVLGRFNVRLRNGETEAPLHVANFLNYVRTGAYTNTFFHRTAKFGAPSERAITQGGGFRLPYSSLVAQGAALALEGTLIHRRGSLAAARLGTPRASATNQFFFNTTNNTSIFFPGNLDVTTSYSVFGEVFGAGLAVLDAIAAVPVYDARDGSTNTTAFNEIPLRNKTTNLLTEQNLIVIRSITEVPLYPAASEASVLTFDAQSSNPAVARVSITGSTLTLTPGAVDGAATVTVNTTDTNGGIATTTFTVSTSSELAIVRHPQNQTVSAGDVAVLQVVAFGVGPSYQWQRDERDVPGATDSILILKSVTPANAGLYTVKVSNTTGSVTSLGAQLAVVDDSAKGRLSNLSVRAPTGPGEQILIAGFVVSGTGSSELAIRGIGPTLSLFGVTGFLQDPKLELYATNSPSNSELLGTNDDWTVSDGSSAGGFRLPPASKDAVLSAGLSAKSYTAHVRGVDDAVGETLIELYEMSPASSSAELINLSARTRVAAGRVFINGFTIAGGTNRTVLIRAIGPGLAALGVTNALTDPTIAVYNSGGTKIDENDNWAGRTALVDAMASVGAFPIADLESKDAIAIATLPPGGYTAHVTGPAGTGGVVLFEVYLVR